MVASRCQGFPPSPKSGLTAAKLSLYSGMAGMAWSGVLRSPHPATGAESERVMMQGSRLANWSRAAGAGAVLAVCLLGALAPAFGQGGPSAYDILHRLAQNKGQVTFEGERKIIRYQDGAEVVVKEIVKQQGPDQFMHIIIYPAQSAGTAELQTSTALFNWGPGRAVSRVPLPLSAAEARSQRLTELNQLLMRYVLVREPDDEVLGRRTYVVLLRSRQTNLPYRRVWADADKWIELKWQLFNPYTGQTEEVAFYTSINFEPEFTEQDFTPPTQVPPDMQNVVQAQGGQPMAAVVVPRPQGLPAGWTVLRQLQMNDRWGASWVVMFRTPTGLVSLTQRQAPKPTDAGNQQSVAVPNTHTWRDDGRLFILTGQVTPTELTTLKRALSEAAKAAAAK